MTPKALAKAMRDSLPKGYDFCGAMVDYDKLLVAASGPGDILVWMNGWKVLISLYDVEEYYYVNKETINHI